MDFQEKLLEIDLEDYMQLIREAFTRQTETAVLLMQESLLDQLSKEAPIKYIALLFVMAETELKRVAESKKNVRVSELMEDYIRTERMFYESLFKPECFTRLGIKWLSPECQSNDLLVRFLNGGKSQPKLLIEAAKLRPDLAQVIKVWLGELQ